MIRMSNSLQSRVCLVFTCFCLTRVPDSVHIRCQNKTGLCEQRKPWPKTPRSTMCEKANKAARLRIFAKAQKFRPVAEVCSASGNLSVSGCCNSGSDWPITSSSWLKPWNRMQFTWWNEAAFLAPQIFLWVFLLWSLKLLLLVVLVENHRNDWWSQWWWGATRHWEWRWSWWTPNRCHCISHLYLKSRSLWNLCNWLGHERDIGIQIQDLVEETFIPNFLS